MKQLKRFTWLGYLLWAVFVNACNEWIVRPLLLDYAALGLIALVVVVLLWLFSIPRSVRRRWIGFTVFSLLFGTGAGALLNNVSLFSVVMVVISAVGLMVLAWFMTKVKWRQLIIGALAIVVANLWLPLGLWPFLTHFQVAYHTTLPVKPGDFPTVPLEVVNTSSGQEVVSLKNVHESPTALAKSALQADNTPNALENLLRNYDHRYGLVSLTETAGRFHLQDLTPTAARSVDPLHLVTTFFPTIRAYWAVESNHIVQYMAPVASPRVMSELGMTPGNVAANLLLMAQQTESDETASWGSLLQPYGGVKATAPLTIQNGSLTGTWNGKQIHVPVAGYRVVGEGSFTGTNLHQVLIEGANLFEVVSLDTQTVVSVYHGDAWNPLSNDTVTGPVNDLGRDVVFVNSSPAQILEPAAQGSWKVLYTAPNASLRFEASIQYKGDHGPEIITDDPSYMRNSPTRYFSSYTYRDGQLVRNWRVYKTNVVNVHSVQFQKSGPKYVVAAIYGTGQIIVLKRHFLPVMPVSIVVLLLVILAGYGIRVAGKRGGVR